VARWAAFLGLTTLLITLLLGLARLSQRALTTAEPAPPDGSSEPSGTSSAHRDETEGGPGPTSEPDHETRVANPDEATGGPTAIETVAAGPGPKETATGSPSEEDEEGETAAAGPQEGEPATARYRQSRTPAPAGPDGEEPPTFGPGALLANVVLSQGLFGAAVVAGALAFAIPAPALGIASDPWVGGLPAVGLGVAFGVVVWLGAELAAALLTAAGVEVDEGLRETLAPASPAGWAALLGGALPVVALSEELLFRAALIGATNAGFGTSPWALAVVSAAAFAFGHGAQGRAGVIVTGTLGFVLAAGFVVTGSLLVVVVAHYLVNALEFLVHEYLGLEGPGGGPAGRQA
jgi:membrane protease YdiL (CAAX protease family)